MNFPGLCRSGDPRSGLGAHVAPDHSPHQNLKMCHAGRRQTCPEIRPRERRTGTFSSSNMRIRGSMSPGDHAVTGQPPYQIQSLFSRGQCKCGFLSQTMRLDVPSVYTFAARGPCFASGTRCRRSTCAGSLRPAFWLRRLLPSACRSACLSVRISPSSHHRSAPLRWSH